MTSLLTSLAAAWWLIISYSSLTGDFHPNDAEQAVKDADTTTIYLVRHAEKVTSDAANADPDLSPLGYQRAEALKKRLASVRISAAFTTPYQRSRLTLAPLASAKGIKLQPYKAHEYASLVKEIVGHYRGKTVLVVGHSNTVLEIMEAFGVERPVPSLSDQDYDYLFRVRVPRKGKASVEVTHYY
jgi:broad specificity phosphatase PhoE